MILSLIPLLLSGALAVQDAVRYPSKPGPRDFILDEAKVLKPEDASEIRSLCEDALSKKKAPIIVVTIPSLAAYGAGGWPIERYALNLMSEWGVGWSEWNYGMLLLVSISDRKARIELGRSWERHKDDEAKAVMTDRIIPWFKQGNPSRGILEGVRGLQSIALGGVPSPSEHRSEPVQPGTSSPPSNIPPGTGGFPLSGCGTFTLIGVGLLVVMLVFRMLRGRAASSWGNQGPYGGGYGGSGMGGGGGFLSGLGGGMLGGAVGSMIGNSLGRHLGSSGPSLPFGGGSPGQGGDPGGGGSFGGGSFGGGFSGGGGATGEW